MYLTLLFCFLLQPLAMNLWHGLGQGYSIQVKMTGTEADWSDAPTRNLPDENANSHIITKLEEWMSYQVRVASFNTMGYSEYSVPAETMTREAGRTN